MRENEKEMGEILTVVVRIDVKMRREGLSFI
jgi:hypothetical protein